MSLLIFVLLGVWLLPADTLDVARVAGQDAAAVERYLGASTGSDTFAPPGQTCRCTRMLYWEGRVAIVYVEGQADWIWVDPGIVLENVGRARLWAYHRFATYQLLRARQGAGDGCCASASLSNRLRSAIVFGFAQQLFVSASAQHHWFFCKSRFQQQMDFIVLI